MRRVSLGLLAVVAGGLTLVGCNAVRDAFSPRTDVIARANDQTLSVERVAGWAGNSKQVPLEALALSRLSHVWVDYALFAQALASGKDLRDSTTMVAAMWPVVSQLKWERFHDKLMTRSDLTPQQLDSAYAVGQFRMFQHILIQLPPNSSTDVDAQKRRRAEQLLPQARTGGGARFRQLAAQYSDDPGSKVQGGSLGLSTRGQFVAAFEDAAWQLSPGDVSPVVKSPFGYHIIRRPPLAEVRNDFRTRIQDQIALRSDSVYLDSLAIKRRIAPVNRAPAFVRAAIQDMDASRSSNRVLVDYRGGALRVRNFVRWVSAMDPQVMQALPQATDDQIKQFLKLIAQRDLVIQQAESAKVTLTPEDWQQVRAEHDSAIAMLGSILNLSAQSFDSAATPKDRSDVALTRVNDYLDRVLKGRARYFPVPPALAETLRGQARWSVDEAGVRRALELAQQMRASTDTSQVSPQPRMTPAPGPAPIEMPRQ